MATILNDPGCSTTTGMNTGMPSCVLIPKTIVGMILIPKTMSLSSTDLATVAATLAKLQEWTLNPAATRAYPIGPFAEVAPKDEEPVYNTTGYSVKQFVREGKIGWQFALPSGGLEYQKKLRGFNHTKAYSVLLYDADNVIFGCDDGADGMKGFAIEELYTYPWKPSDGSKPTQFLADLWFASTTELNDTIAYAKMNVDIAGSILGLIDVDLTNVAQASATVTIKVETSVAGVNLYDQYSDELADPDAWTCTKGGNAVTISSVTKDTTNKAFVLTLTTPTGAHVFNLAAPAALEALDIGGAPDNGYESTGSLTVTFS